MKESIVLPVEPNPGFETECYHNFRLSIIFSNPQLLPWYHSHFLNITIKDSGLDQFPQVNFEEHLDIYSDIIKEETVRKQEDWIEYIRKAIQEGHYILAYLNWKNITSSSFYKKEDMIHECIIYGFDDNTMEFHVLAFEVDNKVYGTTKIHYDVFHNEFRRVLKEDIFTQRWFAYYGFPIAKINILPCPSKNLDAKKIYFALERSLNNTLDSKKESIYAIGYFVNDFLASYFKQLYNGRPLDKGEYTMWNMMIHKILLHKTVMINKMDYLSTLFDEQAAIKVKKFFEKSKKQVKLIQGYTFKYQRTSDPQFLNAISECFKKMYQLEKRTMPMLKEYLVNFCLDV
ncbi:hypothetical protein [Cytobacillus pseudoceanisediminis]|uniref:hypothetical protein n=1 Tax=Cytobacillus pseudoceanisediminis TaxID=3051614 RepID=UPI003C2E2146